VSGEHRSAGPEGSAERVVITDRRKVDAKTEPPVAGKANKPATEGSPDVKPPEAGARHQAPAKASPVETESSVDAEVVDVIDDEETPGPTPFAAELEALRKELDERTNDVQRVSAEYANYRKRVDRDRTLVVEQATGAVLSALLPVLDDIDRARDHGDLVGPFSSVAEQLTAALTKFGLTPFGAKGDAFDPTRHEAVAHLTSAEVTEPTCIDVMRRGYLLGERLLRPALVAVADPE
jgi:molecular chaperone GrpE